MRAQCTPEKLEFLWHGRQRVLASLSGYRVTSDGGALLLREVEWSRKILSRLAECFTDHRRPKSVEHSVCDLIRQRVFGIALGYEDVVDHDQLRHDPLLPVLVGKRDLEGRQRKRDSDRGCALAGKSTLNRLELAEPETAEKSRYHKITYDSEAVDRLLVDLFVEAYDTEPDEIVIDVDATDDPVHGNQEGRFFHGYYNHYCYLPLYIFAGDFPLCARLRPSNIDASAGTADELSRVIGQLRESWPHTHIIVRGDSGFARDQIMTWCEANGIDYVFGLARNPRLERKLRRSIEKARRRYLQTRRPARLFRSFGYRTRKSWSRKRRVVGKAEYLVKGANPRFVVTSLPADRWRADRLYEKLYCARGEMENRIKEQQLDLFADRTSTHKMRSNQLRLYLSTFAYILLNELRRLGLAGSELARAYAGTIRLKLLKIGAIVRISTRRVLVQLSGGYPYFELFRRARDNLNKWPPWRFR